MPPEILPQNTSQPSPEKLIGGLLVKSRWDWPGKCQSLDDDTLSALGNALMTEISDLAYVAGAIRECRTILQRCIKGAINGILDFDPEEEHYSRVWALKDAAHNEMANRGLIRLVRIGVDYGKEQLTMNSVEGDDRRSTARNFDPAQDGPAEIMAEAMQF